MPTTASQTYSAARLDPLYDARTAVDSMISVSLPNSVTYAKGTVLAETGTPGTYAAVVAGTATAANCVLQYACTTDGSGNITMTGEWGQTLKSAQAYTHGTFRIQDMVTSGAGLVDANSLAKLGGRVVEGTLGSTGIVTF